MTSQSNLDRSLTALADPTRRAILELVAGGEARVTELAKPFSISLNSVSKHIRVLERAGLVRRRIVGREHIVSFNGQPFDEIATYIENQRAMWSSLLQALDDMLQAEDVAARMTETKR